MSFYCRNQNALTRQRLCAEFHAQIAEWLRKARDADEASQRFTEKIFDLPTDAGGDLSSFPDEGMVSNWAVNALRWAVGNDVLHGTDVGGVAYLDPQAFRDIYTIVLRNGTWNYSSPRTIRLSLSYNF